MAARLSLVRSFWGEVSAQVLRASLRNVRRARALTGLRSAPPVEVAQTPYTVAQTDGRTRLLRYAPQGTRRGAPVLLVPSLIGRYYLLDLLPGRSLVEFLSRRGLEVFVLDWGEPGPADREEDLSAHIARYLRGAVRCIQRVSGAPRVSLVGYSLGGVMSLCYAARWPEDMAGLALLSAPVDFHRQGILSLWASEEALPVDLLVDTYGEMPAWMLRASFLWLKPTLAARDLFTLWDSLDADEPRDDLRALHQWIEDGVPIPGEAYRQIIKALYRENAILHGRLLIEGRPVELRELSCPVLNVMAREDHICPPSASRPLRSRCASLEVRELLIPGAHTAAALGAADELWPQLSDWLAARGSRRALPPADH